MRANGQSSRCGQHRPRAKVNNFEAELPGAA